MKSPFIDGRQRAYAFKDAEKWFWRDIKLNQRTDDLEQVGEVIAKKYHEFCTGWERYWKDQRS